VFTLVLQAIDNAPQAGSLAIVYLDPIPASGTNTSQSAPITAPAPAPASLFTLDGRPALVTALPAGATASTVRLPR
jgi:hypothetical protein